MAKAAGEFLHTSSGQISYNVLLLPCCLCAEGVAVAAVGGEFFSPFPLLSCYFVGQPGLQELLVPPASKHPSSPGHPVAPFSHFLTKCSFLKTQKSGNVSDQGWV